MSISRADALIEAWTDRPEPVGLGACPIISRQRIRNGIGLDSEGRLKQLRPVFYNAAFPAMIVADARPGLHVRVDGVLEDGPLTFQIPDAAPRVRLGFGEQVSEHSTAIDQIGIEADRGRVFIAYRFPFRYTLIPLQRRSCELLAHPSLAAPGGPFV